MTKSIQSIPRLRRWALLLGGLLGTGAMAQGQTLNYATTSAVNVAGTYTDLGTTGTVISTTSTDDANSTAQNIGFTFSYNGASFTQFVLNTNGLIRLGSAAPSAANMFGVYEAGQTATGVDPVGSTSAADVNLIMPFNFDLTAGTGTPEYRVTTTGTSPNQVCTIQWKNVSDKSGTTRLSQYANFSFQTKLYETSNRVEMVYGTATASANTAISRFPSVGIKGSGSAIGQTVLANKTTGAGAWSTTSFISGAYSGTTHNFSSAALPDAGRTYRFDTGTPVVPTPPANDDCAGAITLTPGATCIATTGTTVGATQSLAPIACGGFTGTSDDDVWYKFVATATAHTVTVVGSTSFDAVVDVRSGTCASSANIGCADGFIAGGTETATLSGLTVGSTYFVRVYSYDTAAGTFTVCVTGGGSTGTTCAGVTNVATANPTATATASAVNIAFTAATGATSYAVTLNTTGSTGTPGTTTITASPLPLTGLTPNTSYTVTITTNCSNGGTSTPVTFVFTSPAASTATPPANDDCAGAITLTPGATCTPTTGTTVGATQSLAPIACGGFTGNSDDDVWYKFVATATAHTVTVVGNGTFDAVVDVRSGACASTTNIGCADATTAGGTETATLTGLTVGSTYFVRVYTYDAGTTGTFTICVTSGSTPATCAAVTNAAVVNAGGTATTASATLTFTAVAGATNYAVTLAPTGSAGTPVTLTGSPISLTGLTPNTSYTVTIVTNCSNGGTSTPVTVVFTSGPAVPAPANDNPTGAVALTVSATCTPTTGTNIGATTTTVSGYTNPGTCGIASAPKDVWYSFTTLAGQTTATVTVTGAPAGLVRVFSAATNAGPFTQVTCAAGSTNNTVAGPVSLTGLTGNTTYYISVAGYGSNDTQGSFTICVTGVAAVCPAPTALTAGSITTTGATLTFTPATGVSSYTVTYTAAGGTAQTQAATGSPVVLTGLTSGTAYTVSIVTNCGAGQASAAATTTFTTLAPCNAPTALTAGSITATGATLTFTGGSAGTSYTVTYTAAGGTAQTQTATGSPVTLTGLLAGKQYSVSIVTSCGAGQTSSAATTTFTTLAPAVTNAAAGSITATGASISFTAAAGATNYTVTYTAAGGTAQTQTVTASPVVLTGLTGATAYTVTIVANYPGGGTSSPVTVTFTTPLGTAVRTTLGSGELSVYPNPARQTFTVSLPALGAARTAQVELVNMLGQTISRQSVSLTAGGTRVPFDASGLATGVYSVRVRVEGETAITRLVLE